MGIRGGVYQRVGVEEASNTFMKRNAGQRPMHTHGTGASVAWQGSARTTFTHPSTQALTQAKWPSHTTHEDIATNHCSVCLWENVILQRSYGIQYCTGCRLCVCVCVCAKDNTKPSIHVMCVQMRVQSSAKSFPKLHRLRTPFCSCRAAFSHHYRSPLLPSQRQTRRWLCYSRGDAES